jgi:hypothetical protein
MLDSAVVAKIPTFYPSQAIPFYRALAFHEDPEMRRTAAAHLEHVYILNPRITLELFALLLTDEDPRVADEAREKLDLLDARLSAEGERPRATES